MPASSRPWFGWTCWAAIQADATATWMGAIAGSAWKTNAAGFAFNMNDGFGLVDAAGMTALAPLYSGVTALETHSTGTLAVGQAIPDQGSLVRTVGVNLAAPPPLEEVLVSLAATHTWRGDLSAVLTSPSGTASRLMLQNGQDSADNLSWTFTTNAFWGESPNGTWSLELFDRFEADTGSWQSWDMTLRTGTPAAVPEPAALALAAAALACVGSLRRRLRGQRRWLVGRLAAVLCGLFVAAGGSTAWAQGQSQGEGPPSRLQPGRGPPPAGAFDRSLGHAAGSDGPRLPPQAQAWGVPVARVFSPTDASEAEFRSGGLQATGDAGLADPPTPSGDATTGVGGGTFNLNTFLGADRYYDHATPITGQNTIAFNLEAGHFWNGHETLQHVATNTTNFVNASDTWGLTPAEQGTIPPLYDRHATWAAMLVGGRQTAENPQIRQQGLAPGTDLRSAAIATGWGGNAYALSFGISASSYFTAYDQSFGTADVVNSSYGYTDPGGTNFFTLLTDAMSFQSPGTLHVVSAGNAAAANTVGAPGSGYNTLTVAALGNANGFDTVAGFSSRGPQDFGYFSGGVVTVPGVRAAVDLAAPGESITSAFYGGQTGGNNTSLTGSTNQGSNANAYSSFINGTSFAAPIVAGGAALVASAAKTLPGLAANPDATQSVVVKALLMNAADKTSGWNNGQQVVSVGGTNAIVTTQSLDWAAGAGRMNLATTFDLQVNGQTDVPGTGTGDLGAVVKTGWDYGTSLRGTTNDYVISDWLRGGTTVTTTLTWMRAREWAVVADELTVFEIAQADLNLSVWELDAGNNLTTLIARSESLYNTAEHLSFTLPRSGFYGLRVEYPANTFDNTFEQIWGTAGFPQDYGLAWTAVPEPGTLLLAGVGGAAWLIRRRLTSGRSRPARPDRRSAAA